MTKLTPEEDFALCSPQQISADLAEAQRAAIWRPLAAKLGWKWDAGMGGYINEAHRNYMGREGWAGYFVAEDAEEACWQDGVETVEDALARLDEAHADG